jgi:hypothetical protein
VTPGDTATLYWIKFWVSSEGKPSGCDNETLNGLGLELFGAFLVYYPQLGRNRLRMDGEFKIVRTEVNNTNETRGGTGKKNDGESRSGLPRSTALLVVGMLGLMALL